MAGAVGRIVELSVEECQALLRTQPIGRVVLVDGIQPVAFPVAFGLDGGDIVFRSAPGTKLDVAETRAGVPVAFEVDSFDAASRTGWSVLVKGELRPVTGEVERTRLARLGVPDWVGSEGARWMRIVPREVTGRRVGRPASLPPD